MALVDPPWRPTSVQVTVRQARGLRAKGKSGTNDAYALMAVGKEKYQTSVEEKSVAPMWKEEATFDLPQLQHGGGGDAERSTLRVHVLHRALVGPDKPLGQAVIKLLQLSEDKTRNRTQWFKLLNKSGKADKDRGEVLVDIQFMRNNMTASMFDLSAAGKSRSRLGKLKDKVRGKKRESDDASAVVPSVTQVLTDSEEEGNGNGEEAAQKDEKKKKPKVKLFSTKSNLQRNISQSMSVLPLKNSSLSGSQSSGLNVDSSEGKKKFTFKIHKRSGSSESKDSASEQQKHGAADQSNVCINGSPSYSEERRPRIARAGSNISLASSGRGSVEDVPRGSTPSADSLRTSRQCSPWMEEEEETADGENGKEVDSRLRRKEEERIRMDEMKRKEEEKERVRRQEEAEEKRRRERQILEEEEKRQRDKEQMVRMEEEKRAQEERIRLEGEERRTEEEKVKKEAEKRKFEERIRREEEERILEEKLRQAEERRQIEEERIKEEERIQEEKRRQEEERRKIEERIEEAEIIRREEERRKIEEERIQEAEIIRREEEARIREEKRKIEEERIQEAEIIRREEETRIQEETRKIEERVKDDEKRREEEMRKIEEERVKEQERIRREEEERIQEEKRKIEERIQEEEMRKIEEERIKEAERIRREEEMRKIEEERVKEQERIRREEDERIQEEKKRQEEEGRKIEERIKGEERIRREGEEEIILEERRNQDRMRFEEEESKIREEEERRRTEKEEAKKLENKKRTGNVKEQMESKMKGRVSGMRSAEIASTNAFDENLSKNPFEEDPESPAGPDMRTVKEPAFPQRSRTASSLGRTASIDERDVLGSQREKRPAPQPPGRSQAQNDRSPLQDAQSNNRNQDQGLNAGGVLPQRSVQVIAPLSRTPANNSQTQSNDSKGTANAATRGKRPAPSRPLTVEEGPSSGPRAVPSPGGNVPNERGSEVEQEPVVYGLNPFEDEDEDENVLTARGYSVQSSAPADNDAVAQVKVKSSKKIRAPAFPAKASAAQQTADGGDAGAAGRDGGLTRPGDPKEVQQTPESRAAMVQSEEEKTGGRTEKPPAPVRRLQPVKPLSPLEQQPVSAAPQEMKNKSTGFLHDFQELTKVNDKGMKGPYSQLTQKELISLVLKQDNQLMEKDKKILELELYIDNLIMRIIEEEPSILMAVNSLK
ncbi:rab11 family-interacting protein 1 [Brachionichthys hirsutus]|uniref:rab11 family-interacting protein 1 n=1 Tax=Brachionichthys hirsutus TaxID=412623 RepID=UPI00360507DB